MKRLLCLIVLLFFVALGCTPKPAKACDGSGFSLGGGGQFGSSFAYSGFAQPQFSNFSYGFNTAPVIQTAPVFFQPSFVNHGFGFNAVNFRGANRFNSFNNFAVNPFFNANFVGARFNNFGFNPAFNANVAFGRFGAVRPLAVNFNGRAGVRGPLGFFHPFNANGRASFLPRFR